MQMVDIFSKEPDGRESTGLDTQGAGLAPSAIQSKDTRAHEVRQTVASACNGSLRAA